MEFRVKRHAVGLAFLLNFVLSMDAHPGTGSIKARDTDEISSIKGKLTRLVNLLSAIEAGDENDPLKAALQSKKEGSTAKPGLSEEDMGQGQHNKLPQTPSRASAEEISKRPADVKPYRKLLSPQDSSSIEILAKALSRLKDPNFNNGDSTGDYLGTDNNEPRLGDEKKTQEMETMIARALTRLSQGGSDKSDKSSFNNAASVQQSNGQGQQLREEALRVVEARLIQAVSMAKKLGLSEEDIIQDLENKGERDDKLDELERDLDTLNFHK